MREAIDIAEALRLYRELRNWREVARRLVRKKSAVPFTATAIQAAVRLYDRGLRKP